MEIEKPISKLQDFKESIFVSIVFVVILLPVRVLFVTYIADHWLGSFSLISVITFTLVYLIIKNKLGKVGKIFKRQLFKFHTGKRRYFLYFNLSIALIFFTASIYGVNLAAEEYVEEKNLMKNELSEDSDTFEEILDKAIEYPKPIDMLKGLILIPLLMIYRFDLWATMMGLLNDLSDGYVLHFATVGLVETLEIIGISIYMKVVVLNKLDTS